MNESNLPYHNEARLTHTDDDEGFLQAINIQQTTGPFNWTFRSQRPSSAAKVIVVNNLMMALASEASSSTDLLSAAFNRSLEACLICGHPRMYVRTYVCTWQ